MEASTNPLRITTDSYSLSCAPDRPFVTLELASGAKVAELFVPSSIHTLTGQDDTTGLSEWRLTEHPNEVVLEVTAESSVWERKTYRFRCLPTRFRYEVTLEGAGTLTDAHYFGGYYSGQIRWGSGFFPSAQWFKQGFNPEPTRAERYFFGPGEGSLIDLTGVPISGKDGWFFTPPPYVFAFEHDEGWLGMGVEAKVEENRYTDFRYHGQHGAFYLTLAFEGHTTVSGTYTLPAIGFDFAPGPYEALGAHVEALRASGLVPEVKREKPDWWHTPIFCGWGSQCYLASKGGWRAPSYARQEHYESFTRALEQHNVAPGIVVLDDKWQKTYGKNEIDPEKWPDIRRFVRQQQGAGRRVLLWLKAWDPEGLPDGECIRNAAGMPLAVDPTNPAFEERFRSSIRTMLLDYGADGFKLDFSARIPSGPGITLRGDAWGLELMRRYLSILYSESKRCKSDALVMTHTPHPYLADVLDMIRLNDVNTAVPVNPAMLHRARVARLACPDAVIDTDNWPMPDKAAWRDYVRLQPELGVPSLYFATHLDATGEALDESDYRLIRESWSRHQKGKTQGERT